MPDLWSHWISAWRRKRPATEAPVTGGELGLVGLHISHSMKYMQASGCTCDLRVNSASPVAGGPAYFEELLLWLATTRCWLCGLLLMGPREMFPHNPSNKWSRKYFRGQGLHFFFSFLIFFCEKFKQPLLVCLDFTDFAGISSFPVS